MQKCKTECENSGTIFGSDATCFACAKLERSCRGNHVLEAPLGFVSVRRTHGRTENMSGPARPAAGRAAAGAGRWRRLEQKVSR